jgi:hypothetical protein
LKWLVLGLLLPTLFIVSFAASVTVTAVNYQAQVGSLDYVYYETVAGPSSTTPGANTAQSPPTGSGSYLILVGSSAYLWSPQFSSAVTISAGTWVLDFWAFGIALGSMTVSIYTTTSTGAAHNTIVSGAGETLSAAKTQIVSRFTSPSTTVPAGGYIEVVLTAPTLSAATIYWGSGELTNFQVPYRVLAT